MLTGYLNRVSSQLKTSATLAFFSLLLLIAGLIVNVIQVVNYVIIRSIDIDFSRKVNSVLQYLLYAPLVGLAEWHLSGTLTVYYHDEVSKLIGQEHSLLITNHRYELEMIFTMMLFDKLAMLGRVKSFSKKQLVFVPLFGLNFYLGETILLERNWQSDKLKIIRGLNNLKSYKPNAVLMLEPEGTRFSMVKYDQCLQYARSKNSPVFYKHHLVPRHKGFVLTMKMIKEHFANSCLYNLQIAFDESQRPLTISDLISGQQIHCSVYIKRYAIEDIDVDHNELVERFLYDLFYEKDRLMDHFIRHDRFPGIPIIHRRNKLTLIVLWIQMMLAALVLFSAITYLARFNLATWTISLTALLSASYMASNKVLQSIKPPSTTLTKN